MARTGKLAGIILILLLTNGLTFVKAQELIFEKNPGTRLEKSNFGPNQRHFFHPFISTSFILPDPGTATLATNQPFTGQLNLGFRYKLKLNRPMAVIADCGAYRNSFSLNKDSMTVFPDSLLHISQTLGSSGIFGGFFIRIRLGQRGDYLGNYFDLGVVAQLPLSSRLRTRDLVNTGVSPTVVAERTTRSELRIMNPINYKATFRIGFDRWTLAASYRISPMLNWSAPADLPRLELGIELALVTY